ncbi:MAG: S26 family signal peptidase [Candidatus Levybacteria bacterium]|nr:S26 family signal peptidase [Candidatus Levybacteria bacterium]
MILGLFQITGHSMEPGLKKGDSVLALGIFSVKKGDVIIFQKDSKYFVKRVAEIMGNKVKVLGDNPEDSFDSRNFGEIEKDVIIGKVIKKIKWFF